MLLISLSREKDKIEWGVPGAFRFKLTYNSWVTQTINSCQYWRVQRTLSLLWNLPLFVNWKENIFCSPRNCWWAGFIVWTSMKHHTFFAVLQIHLFFFLIVLRGILCEPKSPDLPKLQFFNSIIWNIWSIRCWWCHESTVECSVL